MALEEKWRGAQKLRANPCSICGLISVNLKCNLWFTGGVKESQCSTFHGEPSKSWVNSVWKEEEHSSTYWQCHRLGLTAIKTKRGSCIRTNSRVVSMLMYLWETPFVISLVSWLTSIHWTIRHQQLSAAETLLMCCSLENSDNWMTSNCLLLLMNMNIYILYWNVFFFNFFFI